MPAPWEEEHKRSSLSGIALRVFHGRDDFLRFNAHSADAAVQVDYVLLVIGESVSIEFLADGRVASYETNAGEAPALRLHQLNVDKILTLKCAPNCCL